MAKFNEKIEMKLREMRRDGLGCKRIAKQLGVSNSTAHRWLSDLGLSGNLESYQKISGDHGYIIVCKQCKGEYKSRYKNKTKFCSDKCRSSYNKRNRGHKRKCEECSVVFFEYKNKKFCSDECRSKRVELNKKKREEERRNRLISKPILTLQCEQCEEYFKSKRKGKRFCCNECQYNNYLHRLELKRLKDRMFFNKKCKECGKHFTTTRDKACYCSRECSNKYGNRVKETNRRKRIKANGKVNWNISIERLLKRDGKECYLCGEDTNKNLDTNHDDYPSIEHVIPVSKGGTHTWDNVKVAHRKCNTEKRDKILNKTMPPVKNF
jgi:HNH endonuclease/Homeodomain-like domain